MDLQELIEEIVLYCLETNDQDLWDILYPFLRAQGFMCYEDIYKTITLIQDLDEINEN